MAWNDNPGNKGRNPWGTPPGGGNGGRKNPWGSGGGNDNGGGGRGPDQPDFDDIFARMQDGMKDIFPANFGSGGGLFLGALIVVVAIWLASGFYIVSPGEHAVIKRFGALSSTADTEGLKYHFPAPVETVDKINVNEIRTMNIGFTAPAIAGRTQMSGRDVPEESLMLTSDFNIVDLDFVVQWNISSAENFMFNIESPENTLRKVAQSAIREVVGQTRMFQIITTERGAVADQAKQIMQKILDDYKSGINITQVLINSAEVHPDVQSAFQDVQSAKQDAEDVQNRAQAYREDIIPKAKGAATRVTQEAEAYKQSVISRATGDADRFNSVLSAYQGGQDVTKERMYIETMESVLKNAQKIILDDNGKQGVVPYLPLNELNRPKAQATDAAPATKAQGQ
ncbi:MAG: FtsH protease activity modulator HflK [Micavibrio aeruginosavorus]|uniref:Protein HflK n=1 Tax=Micavibrio aeruginosavorus TaxID=349221 RepID=A0A2W5N1X3_9BACT|nr:MAG: FtsH protease activity modulator HflK [Micavibrio aeruginosavorus]